MRKLKVLTLGWEFPPLYAGGLGPACYGLTKALSHHVEVSVILPRSEKKFRMKDVNIIGLNNVVNKSRYSSKNYKSFSKVKTVQTDITSVYPVHVSYTNEDFKAIEEKTFTQGETYNLFNENDIYGPNIMQKVAAFSQAVCDLAAKEKFDIIHAHDWITYPAAVRLKHQTLRPLVVHVHSLETDRVHTQSRNSVYEIERIGMINADRVLPVSNFTKGNIIRHYGIETEKIVPVYNGYDTDFSNHSLEQKKSKREKKVLFLGRITSQKGPEYLIETAQKLFNRMSNVKIYIAGTGDLQKHLEWKVKQYGLERKVLFTGFLNKEEVKKLLSETDAYIMPSVSEPFGLSALEAAQFNIPCILSKQSGAAEVMPNTLQVDYWDTDKMANYLFGVLNYHSLSNTLTEKTQNDIPHINWERAAESVLNEYKSLINLN